MLYGVSYQGCLLLFQITIKKAICLQENIETNDFGYDFLEIIIVKKYYIWLIFG